MIDWKQMRNRLDRSLVQLGLVRTRSQAESYIKLGEAKVNGKTVTKPGFIVSELDRIELTAKEQYVSRAALKLASVTEALKLDFNGKAVLDVGSSTGGFTDYALRHGATKVIAVEIGTNQLHHTLRGNQQIELHEQTDIRDVQKLNTEPDMVLADLSFISLREVLPNIAKLVSRQAQIVVMVKPQFEAGHSGLKHKGIVKNDKMRRAILKDFEIWVGRDFAILNQADSAITGAKGNRERFYVLSLRKT